MGSGASASADFAVYRKSLYSAAASRDPGGEAGTDTEDDFCNEDVADDDGGDDEDDDEFRLPTRSLLRLVRGGASHEVVGQKISAWAANLEGKLSSKETWEAVGDSLLGAPRVRKQDLDKLLACIFNTLPNESCERLLRVAAQARRRPLCFALLRGRPGESLATLHDADWLCDPGTIFYSTFDLNSAWPMHFWETQLLPRGRAAILGRVAEKSEVVPAASCVLQDCCLQSWGLPAAARLLDLGASAEGLLTAEEAAELRSLASAMEGRDRLWRQHLRLVRGVAAGDLAAVRAAIAGGADPNFDHVDGHGCTAAPLVLALLRQWCNTSWERSLLGDQGYELRLECQSSLELVKELLATPGLDPSRGAYQYGWHGSHVRVSPLGLLLVEEVDTCYSLHNFALAGRSLVGPRRELLELLIRDPRTDLEKVVVACGERGFGRREEGALQLMGSGNHEQTDYFAARELMRAGALMPRAWLEKLETLGEQVEQAEEVAAELRRRLEELEPAAEEEEEESGETDPPSRSPVPIDGLKYLRRTSCSRAEEVKLVAAAAAEHLADAKQMRDWYEVVRLGSNVFRAPSDFPEAFCKVAATLDRGLRKRLGRGGVCRVLDFLPFFDFNRRRRLGSSWHRCTGLCGIPISAVEKRAEVFCQRICNKLEALEADEPLADEDATRQGEEPDSRDDALDTCWADGSGCGDDE